jgi:hypothetical protein
MIRLMRKWREGCKERKKGKQVENRENEIRKTIGQQAFKGVDVVVNTLIRGHRSSE